MRVFPVADDTASDGSVALVMFHAKSVSSSALASVPPAVVLVSTMVRMSPLTVRTAGADTESPVAGTVPLVVTVSA